MGASYSANKLKVALKTAVARMTRSINKQNNQIRIDGREIASLLQQHKDESARIKVEGLLHQRSLVSVMETLQLMCDLLGTRIAIITHSTSPPLDLEESIASLIYSSQRVEVAELTDIAHQLAAKYGEKPMRLHLDNASGRVNPRVVEKLQITPPDFALVIATMQEVAQQWEVDWKPDLSVLDSGVKPQDPQLLGAIAGGPKPSPVEYKEADLHALPTAARGSAPAATPPGGPRGDEGKEEMKDPLPSRPAAADFPTPAPAPAPVIGQRPAAAFQSFPSTPSSPSDAASYPGTLNIILLQARDLPHPTGQATTVVRITQPSVSPTWSWASLPSLPSPAGSSATSFPVHQHCPLSVAGPQALIVVEVVHGYRGGVGEEVVGGLSIEAEQMRRSGVDGTWYTIFSSHSHAPRGQVLLASQYIPMVMGGGGGGGQEPVYHRVMEAAPGGAEGEPPAYDGGAGREGELNVPLVREELQARGGKGAASRPAAKGKDADLQDRFNQLG